MGRFHARKWLWKQFYESDVMGRLREDFGIFSDCQHHHYRETGLWLTPFVTRELSSLLGQRLFGQRLFGQRLFGPARWHVNAPREHMYMSNLIGDTRLMKAIWKSSIRRRLSLTSHVHHVNRQNQKFWFQNKNQNKIPRKSTEIPLTKCIVGHSTNGSSQSHYSCILGDNLLTILRFYKL